MRMPWQAHEYEGARQQMFLFQGTRDDKIVMVHKPIFAPLEEVLVNGEFAGPEELAAHESRAACFGGWPEVERAAVSAQLCGAR